MGLSPLFFKRQKLAIIGSYYAKQADGRLSMPLRSSGAKEELVSGWL
jgi:hypothetical protein